MCTTDSTAIPDLSQVENGNFNLADVCEYMYGELVTYKELIDTDFCTNVDQTVVDTICLEGNPLRDQVCSD